MAVVPEPVNVSEPGADELTEQQIKDFRKVFNQFDKDGGGSIDAKELGDAMRWLGQSPSELELQEMIADVDVDNDGTIDFKEFINMMASKIRDNDTEEDIFEALTVFDKERTGRIGATELKHILIEIGEQMTPEEVDIVYADTEISDDGTIDLKKFSSLLMK